MRGPSLRLRLTFAGAGAISLALALAYFGLVILFERHTYRTLSDELDAVVQDIEGQVTVDALGRAALAQPPSDPRFEAPLSGYYWQVGGGAKLLRSRSLWDDKLDLPRGDPEPGQIHVHQIAGPEGKLLLVAERSIIPAGAPGPGLRIAVASDLSRLRRARDDFAADLAPSLALLATVLGAAMWLQLTLGLHPLAKLRTGVNAIAQGRAQRLPEEAPDEVRPLVAEVNGLLDARDATVERAKSRAADLAHGLKTPLAAIFNDAERLRRGGQAELARSLEVSAEAMRRHIERELARARLSGPALCAPLAPVRAVAQSVVEILKRTDRGEDLDFRVEASPDLKWPMERADLTEALGNLLDNAARYAKSIVRVSAPCPSAIDVEDDGPGVAPEAGALIRERGRRLDESGSAGLGVAIVQEILEAYGGTLVFEKASLGGLKARLLLSEASFNADRESRSGPAVQGLGG